MGQGVGEGETEGEGLTPEVREAGWEKEKLPVAQALMEGEGEAEGDLLTVVEVVTVH